VEVLPERNKTTKQIIGFWLISDLGDVVNNPGALSAPALLKLMEKSHEMAPYFFTFNQATKHIAMNFEYPYGTADKNTLQTQFNNLFTKIRDTYPLWKSDVLVAAGGNPNPNPIPNPVPNPIPNPQAELVNSQWTGSETLQGYGKLTFKFAPGGQATMIDSDGATPGTWSQAGNQVTLKFYSGQVTYQATINGTSMTGTATNGGKSWTFSLNRQ
jgi:hypothetical protein